MFAISHFLLDFIFPPRCVFCAASVEGNLLCKKCQAQFRLASVPVQKIAEYPNLDAVLVANASTPELRRVVHAFKYKMYTRAADLLAGLLIKTVRVQKLPTDTLVLAVPLHWTRRWWRGFNQSAELGRRVAQSQGWEFSEGNLYRARRTKSQARLRRAARLQNLVRAFGVRDPRWISGRTVLLVDDVATTGATLGECATVLKNAGARRVVGLALMRGGVRF